jgi:hypothetical protein
LERVCPTPPLLSSWQTGPVFGCHPDEGVYVRIRVRTSCPGQGTMKYWVVLMPGTTIAMTDLYRVPWNIGTPVTCTTYLSWGDGQCPKATTGQSGRPGYVILESRPAILSESRSFIPCLFCFTSRRLLFTALIKQYPYFQYSGGMPGFLYAYLYVIVIVGR